MPTRVAKALDPLPETRAGAEALDAVVLAAAGLRRLSMEQRITELYAATDVYLWKLFRRDLRLNQQQAAEAFRRLVLGVIRPDEISGGI